MSILNMIDFIENDQRELRASMRRTRIHTERTQRSQIYAMKQNGRRWASDELTTIND